ncbi:MAG: hypothetical protein PUA61_08175 [Succinatimonas hippei]|nr:hypothetical protein [Succinatimonas hippei]
MKQLGIAALIAVLLVIGGFGFGAFITSNHYQKQIAEFKADAERQYAQALEAKATREKYLQGKIEDAASNARQAQSAIEERYQMLLDAARRVPADVPGSGDADDADGMHADAGGAGGQGGVSATATASRRVSESTGSSSGYDRAKLQRLYEKQLLIARDCDITASHYNQLIDFYTKASNAD